MSETTKTARYVPGDPYPFPWNGDLRPENTALVVIDMQTDFCGKGGYIDLMGYDISVSRACIAPIRAVLAKMRAGGFHIMHTREGHRPDLADLPGQQALALAPDQGERGRRHRRRRPLRPHPGPRRARLGDHPRAGAAARRDDHRQAGQGDLLRDRLRSDPAAARDRQPDPDRHHHRRLRAHDDARGERSRLRVRDPRGLLRGDRRRQPRGGDQDGEDAERRVRHGVDLARAAGGAVMSLEIGDGARAVVDAATPALEALGISKQFGSVRALENVSLKLRARVGARAARRERRRQEHARQVHHGLLLGRRGAGAGERRRRGHQEPARRGRARHRDGLPALHAGRQHDGGREPGAGAPRASRSSSTGRPSRRRSPTSWRGCRSSSIRSARCACWRPARSRSWRS